MQGSDLRVVAVVVVVVVEVVVVGVVEVVVVLGVVMLGSLLWMRLFGREAVREKDRKVKRRSCMLSWWLSCFSNSNL